MSRLKHCLGIVHVEALQFRVQERCSYSTYSFHVPTQIIRLKEILYKQKREKSGNTVERSTRMQQGEVDMGR